MIEIKLPFWLSADETKKLITAAKTWWQRAEDWTRWPLGQLDPLTCSFGILNLLAWQRDLEQFKDEPESLFRMRVKYALINAQDAGSKIGFINIFKRLGIGYLEIEERVDPIDWDVILLRLSDSQIARNTQLLMHIIRQYGRTCRRYQLVVMTPISLTIKACEAGCDYRYDVARQILEPCRAIVTLENNTLCHEYGYDLAQQSLEPYLAQTTVANQSINHDWSLDIAKL